VDNLRLATRLIDRIARDTTTVLEEELTFGRRDELTKKVRRFVHERGEVTWRDICRRLHRHSAASLKSALDTLKAQGEVEAGVGAKGGQVYRWIG
jgi:hypothetical protein